LEIVPSQKLGFKARIAFDADPTKAAAALKTRGITFTRTNHSLSLNDPDGNEIILGHNGGL
jgi:hypothetical protein